MCSLENGILKTETITWWPERPRLLPCHHSPLLATGGPQKVAKMQHEPSPPPEEEFKAPVSTLSQWRLPGMILMASPQTASSLLKEPCHIVSHLCLYQPWHREERFFRARITVGKQKGRGIEWCITFTTKESKDYATSSDFQPKVLATTHGSCWINSVWMNEWVNECCHT